MDCTQIYLDRFEEIKLLSRLAESDSRLGGDVIKANAITRSGLVLLCGYFEGFVREMCKEFVETINDSSIAAKDLPLITLSEHSVYCLEKFKKKNVNKFDELINGLASGKSVSLDSEKLSATNANPTVDTIERIFEAFDMPNILDVITMEDYSFSSMYNYDSQLTEKIKSTVKVAVGEDSSKELSILEEIERKWAPKKKRRRVGYLNEIDELLKKRNRIAHGEGFEVVTYNELYNTTNIIIRLCNSLVAKLEAKISELTT
ncbi:MAE_28990/MAE_18760 family HEPN-like nuclease [Brenneria populi]|uniref:MAE_28990/MAE_18760 family HEPN-like nuclease n=1 Tax=Brenneria populi TaxID=1505588 RepID=A0ABU6JQN7_9GAMM|nr:MAE_28990/MAE_18760 family HEPN-like nuclease [Brenneria populi Li et al. 2015]